LCEAESGAESYMLLGWSWPDPGTCCSV